MGYRHKTMSDRPLDSVIAERDAHHASLIDHAASMSPGVLVQTKLIIAVLTQHIEIRTKEQQP